MVSRKILGNLDCSKEHNVQCLATVMNAVNLLWCLCGALSQCSVCSWDTLATAGPELAP